MLFNDPEIEDVEAAVDAATWVVLLKLAVIAPDAFAVVPATVALLLAETAIEELAEAVEDDREACVRLPIEIDDVLGDVELETDACDFESTDTLDVLFVVEAFT